MQEVYYVYIIKCSDNSYYVGLTNDLIKRFQEHLDGIYPNCYTFKRRPLTLEYYETIPFLNDAIAREKQLKGWSRAKKKAIITANFHKLQLLSQCQNMSHQKYYHLQQDFDATQSNPAYPSTSLMVNAERSRSMLRVGILGGGQLGRMLLQTAANYPVETFVMENDIACPAAHLCHHFTNGDITNFDDVYNFGKQLDAITIEIESVNEDALQKLEDEGVKVYPKPSALKIIKNKILQKQFYKKNNIPTAEFVVTQAAIDLQNHADYFPAIHKIAVGGYDGRGVISIRTKNDKGFDEAAVLEKKVNIKKEIAIIAASDGEKIVLYPAVEMIFNPDLNLLDHQLCPANISEKNLQDLKDAAMKVVKNLNSAGIFAIEMFIDKDDNVLVNETAPRVHNSGHHTIEANYSSQFDMLWRIMLGYPLGNTKVILPSAMVNLIGEKDFSGKVKYEGLEEILKIENAFVHLYGKTQTRPGRKMGHVTIMGEDINDLTEKVKIINKTLKAKA